MYVMWYLKNINVILKPYLVEEEYNKRERFSFSYLFIIEISEIQRWNIIIL